MLETVTEPIQNLAKGEPHRIQVVLPEGMEYKQAEIGLAKVNRCVGTIRYDRPNGHSSLAWVEQTEAGLRPAERSSELSGRAATAGVPPLR